jgi:hypothetical protein
LLQRVGTVTGKMEIYAKIYSERIASILTVVKDINHIVWCLSIQRKSNVSSSEWFVVWTSMENDFNGLRHTKCPKNYGMHILQRMYVSVIISIDNNSCYLPSYECWRGARTSDLQCHVEPSSYRWVTPKKC